MRRHMRDCASCAHHDAIVRRSLMLVRSLPVIEPSPDFQARLEARLRTTRQITHARRPMQLSFGTFVAIAATVGFAAFLAISSRRETTPEIQLAPVVATLPANESQSHLSSSALVATVPTGMSVWPAIMVATQAPIHLVAAEMADER